MGPRVVALTAVALACFAGNSLLCRPALADASIEPATFTAVRLATGAATLSLLARGRPMDTRPARAKWISAAALLTYAAPFSYAYVKLGAAVGALLLFAAVQATMIGWGIRRGERPNRRAWIGIGVAFGGLVALTAPGRSAPDARGAAIMVLAGLAWGVYSLRGRTTTGDPVVTTASSFTRATLMAAPLFALTLTSSTVAPSPRGLLFAAISGTIASGAGYSVWYAALRHLSATQAAVLQLLVPVLAAAGAIAWLGERPSARLVAASAAILGGVALTIVRAGADAPKAAR